MRCLCGLCVMGCLCCNGTCFGMHNGVLLTRRFQALHLLEAAVAVDVYGLLGWCLVLREGVAGACRIRA